MQIDPELVRAMFARHGVRGPWAPLHATGVANRIYATRDVVLRVATDHPDAVPDARTESVAAPAAFAAGILTPRLIAFDDSRSVVDRPFSLWERVHGETLGLLQLDPPRKADLWRRVGRELSRLHHRVTLCPDPAGYLDTPGRPLDLHPLLQRLAAAGRVDRTAMIKITRLIDELAPHVAAARTLRFVHDDIHPMNVMCSPDGGLLAIIDWGDAGWGDPTLDFAAVPLDCVQHAVEGYTLDTPGALGDFPEARFVWDKLHYTLEEAWENGEPVPPVDAFYRLLRANPSGRGST
ncbi:MAG: aminoglycoside phosphotransferase family protein [Gemmatimonadetes bacterium]|nr:aminoglycoside phosphotransferase family protein [Gemmatimonadota bacterium]